MQLTALTDLNEQAGDARADIPCLEYDAGLWFAESPVDVEAAKTLCEACPALTECLPVRLSVRSRGASGAVSSSSRGRSSRASVPVDVRVRTRPPPEVSRQLAGCFCSSCAVLDHASDPFSTSFTAMVGKPSQGAPPCTHH